MFCLHCATPIDPSQRFCPTCGKPAPNLPPPNQPPPAEQFSPPPIPQFSPMGFPAMASARPGNVGLAAGIIFLTVAITFVSTAYSLAHFGATRLLTIPSFLMTPIFLTVWVIFTIVALQGKNWARIGLAILTGWSALTLLVSLRFLMRGSFFPMAFAFPGIVLVLRILACYLLFTPDSSAWFKSKS